LNVLWIEDYSRVRVKEGKRSVFLYESREKKKQHGERWGIESRGIPTSEDIFAKKQEDMLDKKHRVGNIYIRRKRGDETRRNNPLSTADHRLEISSHD